MANQAAKLGGVTAADVLSASSESGSQRLEARALLPGVGFRSGTHLIWVENKAGCIAIPGISGLNEAHRCITTATS